MDLRELVLETSRSQRRKKKTVTLALLCPATREFLGLRGNHDGGTFGACLVFSYMTVVLNTIISELLLTFHYLSKRNRITKHS